VRNLATVSMPERTGVASVRQERTSRVQVGGGEPPAAPGGVTG
jgi:hypothetical protein